MLIRLNSHQIEQAWDYLAPSIAEALPDDLSIQKTPYSKILQAALAERAHIWVEISPEQGAEPRAVVLTTFRKDPIMETRHMILYAVTMLQRVGQEDWKRGLETLKTFARENNCENMVSYVGDETYAKLLSRMGGTPQGMLITFELDK